MPLPKLALLLGCYLLISSCRTPVMPQPQLTDLHIAYLALGDSYTIGEQVDTPLRYPIQLGGLLAQKSIFIDTTKIIARTGWTTADLTQGIDAAAISAKKYGFVSLLIGVNNQYRSGLGGLAGYRTEFTQLLQKAIGFANQNKSHVCVVSIPDYGVTPFGQGNAAKITAEIDKYNAAAKEICVSQGIAFFNITEISRTALGDPSLTAIDGLHPSGKMYGLWASAIQDSVSVLLRK